MNNTHLPSLAIMARAHQFQRSLWRPQRLPCLGRLPPFSERRLLEINRPPEPTTARADQPGVYRRSAAGNGAASNPSRCGYRGPKSKPQLPRACAPRVTTAQERAVPGMDACRRRWLPKPRSKRKNETGAPGRRAPNGAPPGGSVPGPVQGYTPVGEKQGTASGAAAFSVGS